MKIPPKWIIGNWKMHKTISEAVEFVREILPVITHSLDDISLAVPFTSLHTLAQECRGTSLDLGVQNIHSQPNGAFTGEISAEMAADAGATFVLIGHSERRHIFHESDTFINKKVHHALQAKLKVVLCIGELQSEKDEGNTRKVLMKQLKEGLHGVDTNALAYISVAYEPVWAIGSGVAASPETAQECHHFCRSLLAELYDLTSAKKVKILYGGSVQPENVATFLENDDIDGVLVGKASLSTPLFAKIIKFRHPDVAS